MDPFYCHDPDVGHLFFLLPLSFPFHHDLVHSSPGCSQLSMTHNDDMPYYTWLTMTSSDIITYDVGGFSVTHMFCHIYYKLYIFNYKYPVVAVVRPQSCLHLNLAIHKAPCLLPLYICLYLAVKASSETLNSLTVMSQWRCLARLVQI